MNNVKNKKQSLQWKKFFGFYRRVQIPWIYLIITAVLSFGVKQLTLMAVPYQSKIMTGAILEQGFLGGFLCVTLFLAAMEAVQEGLNELSGVVMARNVRRSVWQKMLHLPMSFYGRGDNQKLVSRVTQDTTGAYGAIAVLVQGASILYAIWTSFKKMYITYQSLALIMLAMFPLTIFISWAVGKLQYRFQVIVNTSISDITNFFGERLPHIIHIKTCNTQDREYELGVKASEERYQSEKKAYRIHVLMGPLGSMSQYINQVILLLIASYLVRQGSMKMFQMVNLYNYFLVFMSNAFMITAIWQSIKLSHGSLETIGEIMATPEEDLTSGEEVENAQMDIRFSHVSFSYDEKNELLHDINFTIPAGKKTAIAGENGSGKSTMLKMLEGYLTPTAGEILVGSRPLDGIKLGEWREQVGYLAQSDHLIKGSIYENISIGAKGTVTESEVYEAAKKANAYDFITNREDGFDSQVSHFDQKCSGGEMQRIAIARIMLKKPEILLMDEATSGIDVVSVKEILEGLMDVMKNRTVVYVSHDLEMIRQADHVIVIADGRVQAEGTYEEVRQESALIQQFEAVRE